MTESIWKALDKNARTWIIVALSRMFKYSLVANRLYFTYSTVMIQFAKRSTTLMARICSCRLTNNFPEGFRAQLSGYCLRQTMTLLTCKDLWTILEAELVGNPVFKAVIWFSTRTTSLVIWRSRWTWPTQSNSNLRDCEIHIDSNISSK